MSESGAPDSGGAGPEAPPGEGVPAGSAARPISLSILLALIVVANVLGPIRALRMREELMREIPRMTPGLFTVWIAAAPLAITGAVGLWFLWRWGLYAIGLAWVMTLMVDIGVGATSHAILATGIMWLVVLFVRPIRPNLR